MMQRFIFILLLSISAIQCGVIAESNLRSSSVSNQRRELSWWNMFLMHLGPPHPHHHSSSSSNGNSNNNDGGSGGEMTSQSGSDETTSSVQSQYAETTDSSSSSSGSSGYGVFEDVAKYFSNGGDSANGSAGISIDSTSAANVFMFAAAALVAGLVGAALVVMRKKRNNQTDAAEPLSGESGFNEVTSVPHGSMGTVSIRSASYAAPVVA